jgi:hypothetical protein
MVRHSLHQVIALGRFNDALQWARDLNAVSKKRGWSEAKVMVPTVGPVNAFILEWEYADHASFEKEGNAFYQDAEAMATYRRGIEVLAAGHHPWDELEEEAPTQLA